MGPNGTRAHLAACILAFAAGCASPELDPVEQLYLQTATGPGVGDTQVQAVRELAKLDDPRVEDMLIRIAQTATEPGRDRLSIEAVRQLRLRGSASAVPDLASLLSPDRTLELRQELALAYAQLGCPAVCIKATLGYLERIWQGELNIEERRFESVRSHVSHPSMIPTLPPAVVKQQEQIYEALYQVLRRVPDETASSLSEDYDLGGPTPARPLPCTWWRTSNSSKHAPPCSLAGRHRSLRPSQRSWAPPSRKLAAASKDELGKRYNDQVADVEKRHITARVIRPGDAAGPDLVPDPQSASERLRMVGVLTRACMGWQLERPEDVRLQRTVVRIQRPQR